MITLRVSPRAGALRPDQIKQYFLSELKRCYGGTLTTRIWQHAEGVRVIIAEPLPTPVGKVLPLHLLGRPVER